MPNIPKGWEKEPIVMGVRGFFSPKLKKRIVIVKDIFFFGKWAVMIGKKDKVIPSAITHHSTEAIAISQAQEEMKKMNTQSELK